MPLYVFPIAKYQSVVASPSCAGIEVLISAFHCRVLLQILSLNLAGSAVHSQVISQIVIVVFLQFCQKLEIAKFASLNIFFHNI
jgi:hypothetical protein